MARTAMIGAALACLSVDARPAGAQRAPADLPALEVWLACRHPKASSEAARRLAADPRPSDLAARARALSDAEIVAQLDSLRAAPAAAAGIRSGLGRIAEQMPAAVRPGAGEVPGAADMRAALSDAPVGSTARGALAEAVLEARAVQIRARYAVDESLANLCGALDLPRGSTHRVASSWAAWERAIRGTLALPSRATLQAYADDVDRARRQLASDSRQWFLAPATPGIDLGIYFAPDSARVDLDVQQENVRRVARAVRAALEANPSEPVVITGAADRSGSAQKNVDLALARARNVVQAILAVDNAIDPSRLRVAIAPQGGVPAGRTDRVEGKADTPDEVATAIRFRSAGAVLPRAASAAAGAGDGVEELEAAAARRRPLDRTSLALALTDVIIDRAQRDLGIAVLEEALPRLCGIGQPWIHFTPGGTRVIRFGRPGGTPPAPSDTLFLNTCRLAPAPSATDTVLFRPALGTLKTALRADVSNALPAVVELVVEPAASSPVPGEVLAVVRAALAYANLLESGRDPVATLAALPRQAAVFRRLPDAVQTPLCRVTTGARIYADARAEIPGNLRGEVAGPVGHDDRPPADTVLLYTARAYLVNAHAAGRPANDPCAGRLLATAAADPAVEPFPLRFRRVFAALAALDSVEQAASRPDVARASASGVRAALAAGDLAARYRAYAAVIVAAVDSEPEGALWARVDSIARPVNSLLASIAAGQYRAALTHLSLLLSPVPGSTDRFPHLPPEFLRPLTLAADVAEATDAEGAEDALRRFVDQGGGYRAKRVGTANARRFGLNAYAGGMVQPVAPDGGRREAGWFVPVGFEAGVRRPTWHLGGGKSRIGQVRWPSYAGVFAYPLDLGALAPLRANERGPAPADAGSATIAGATNAGATNVEEDVRLSQILAPGVAAVVAPFRRWPLTLGGNFQWRRSAAGEPMRGRFSVFVGADVPLFP